MHDSSGLWLEFTRLTLWSYEVPSLTSECASASISSFVSASRHQETRLEGTASRHQETRLVESTASRHQETRLVEGTASRHQETRLVEGTASRHQETRLVEEGTASGH